MAKSTKPKKALSPLQFLCARPTGNFRPVYAFVGKDDYLAWRCLHKLKQLVLGEDYPGSTLKELDEVQDPRRVFDELRTTPFLGMEGFRLVSVRGGDKFVSAAREQLEEYLAAPNPTSILALCCKTLPSNTRVYKAAVDIGCVVDCKPLRWRDMQAWTQLCARGLGMEILPAAVQELLNVVGMSPGAVESEMEKLAAYRAEEGRIEPRDVQEIVGFSKSQSVFELIDHVNRRDAAQALEVLRRLLLAGESVQMVVSMLARNYRQLWQVYRMRRTAGSPRDVAAEVGVPTFVAEKLLKQTAAVRDEREFAVRIERLARADIESKTLSISDESQRWIETLIVELCGRA